MTPHWRAPREGDDGKYAFIRELPDDAPPTLLRSYKALPWSVLSDAFRLDADAPRKWQYWTVAGWADVRGDVCVCERPEDAKASDA